MIGKFSMDHDLILGSIYMLKEMLVGDGKESKIGPWNRGILLCYYWDLRVDL